MLYYFSEASLPSAIEIFYDFFLRKLKIKKGINVCPRVLVFKCVHTLQES